MADSGFIEAVDHNDNKRMVPPHYLDAPFNFKLPPKRRGKADPATVKATEPARPEKKEEAKE